MSNQTDLTIVWKTGTRAARISGLNAGEAGPQTKDVTQTTYDLSKGTTLVIHAASTKDFYIDPWRYPKFVKIASIPPAGKISPWKYPEKPIRYLLRGEEKGRDIIIELLKFETWRSRQKRIRAKQKEEKLAAKNRNNQPHPRDVIAGHTYFPHKVKDDTQLFLIKDEKDRVPIGDGQLIDLNRVALAFRSFPVMADVIAHYINEHQEKVREEGRYLYITDSIDEFLENAGFNQLSKDVLKRERKRLLDEIKKAVEEPVVIPIYSVQENFCEFWRFFSTKRIGEGIIEIEVAKPLYMPLLEDKNPRGVAYLPDPLYSTMVSVFEDNREEIRERCINNSRYKGRKFSDNFHKLYIYISLETSKNGKRESVLVGNYFDLASRALFDCLRKGEGTPYYRSRIIEYLEVFKYLTKKMAERGVHSIVIDRILTTKKGFRIDLVTDKPHFLNLV